MERKMVKNKMSHVLSAILLLMLSACNWGTSDPTLLDGDPPLVPAVQMTVQADTSAPINAVGQTIQYTYNIRNTGTVALPGVITVIGATVNCPPVNTIGDRNEFLDVGEEITCISSYTTVQADLDKGSITTVTTANVNGTLSNEVTTTINTVPNRMLTLTKSASPTTYDTIGQTITYTYVITNSGTLDIGPTQFIVNDTGFSTPHNCGNADTTLAPNATVTCSNSYAVTQADMDAGSINTNATASGGGVGPSQPASATVTKNAGNSSGLTPGSTLQHTVVDGEWLWQIARCYGADPKQVVLANSQLPNSALIKPDTIVSVPNIGSAGKIYGKPCVGTHTVQSGETWNSIAQKYNADPIVLQMVNKNSMPVGSIIKVPLNSAGGTISTPTSEVKALTLTTAANPQTYNQAGQTITFSYSIKNSGNVTLGPAQFTVSGSLFGNTPLNCGAADTTLTPGAAVACTSPYTITEADLTVNTITNNATAAGAGAGPSQTASATINKSVTSLSLVAAASPLTFNQVGQQITYTYVIKNNGNITLGPAQFTITDSLMGNTPFNCGSADVTLAPSEMVTCTTTYTITEADITAVFVTNSAVASGGGAVPSQPASITINKE